jgi:stage II sporulation protein AB (anti-sigma F factor)
MINKMKLTFSSLSENEAFSRSVVAAFIMPLNPTISEICDIKTAVSEAVTNAVVHGYPDTVGDIILSCEIDSDVIHIKIQDYGIGISNVPKALEPFYTTKGDLERSGMGFTIMQSFMDSVEVISSVNQGTTIIMSKKLER